MVKRSVLPLVVVLLAGGVGGVAETARADEGRADALPSVTVGVAVDSGVVRHAGARGDGPEVVYVTEVTAAGAPWMRLWFDRAELAGTPGVDGSYLVITSMEDGAWQRLDAEHIEHWSMSSAYFNGDTVLVELWAYPGTGDNRLALTRVTAGEETAPTRSICGETDDRVLSYDPRAASINGGCTGWLIDHGGSANRFLTAGHCISGTTTGAVMFFNVPLSTASGGFRAPGPEYQYPVQAGSIQSSGNGGVGNDMATFQTHANSNTGMAPLTAQGAGYVLSASVPSATGQAVRVTGYGLRDSNFPDIPLQWNTAQKTHTGPLTARTGTAIRYRPDTVGGNSGSPVILESTGQAIGIHTHGGCGVTGGNNNGTRIDHPTLQGYLASPLGTSIPRAMLSELSTGFASNDGSGLNGAVYFDVSVDAAPVRVRTMDLNIGSAWSTEFLVFVYRTDGGAEGKALSPWLWTLVGEGRGLSAGTDGRTRVVLTRSFELEEQRTHGLAVLLAGASHRYTTVGSGGGGGASFSTPEMVLTSGWATDAPFSAPVLDGRVFNGALGYEVLPAPVVCRADINGDGVLNFFDVSAFVGRFGAQDPAADFNQDGLLNFFDFSAFLNAFNAGCP